MIVEFAQQVHEGEAVLTDLDDPTYRSYVLTALAKGHEDVTAGRFSTVSDALNNLKTVFQERYGL